MGEVDFYEKTIAARAFGHLYMNCLSMVNREGGGGACVHWERKNNGICSPV